MRRLLPALNGYKNPAAQTGAAAAPAPAPADASAPAPQETAP
jgi:hypothetical protein